MHLLTGSPAPRFEVVDAWGIPVRLDDYAGRPLLLSFFRNALCAVCNLRVHQLTQRYPAYRELGLAVITVFESPAERVRDHLDRQDFPFTLIADPTARLYDLYGVETSAEKVAATMERPETPAIIATAAAAGFMLTPEAGSNFHRIPADFLINPDLTIARAHYAEFVTNHLGFDAIEEFIARVPVSA